MAEAPQPQRLQLDDLDLKIPSFDNLIRTKRPCPKCNRSRAFYCQDCFVNLPGKDGWTIPAPELPMQLDVVHHPGEKRKKSSALASACICPKQIRALEFPDDLPDYDPETTILLFPSPDAISVKELPPGKYKCAVVIESTWLQTKRVLRHPKIACLPRARIDSYVTRFWRYQKGMDETCLATVEAMYYFCREVFVGLYPGQAYDGRYDNMLYYFKLQYDIIQEHYRSNPQRTFTSRHFANYIRYDDTIEGNEHLFKPQALEQQQQRDGEQPPQQPLPESDSQVDTVGENEAAAAPSEE